jgi:hypothetical protein
MKEREITHMKTMTNTGEVSSGIIGKRVERWKWRQIAPCATEKPEMDGKIELQVCGVGGKSQKRFTLDVKMKPYGKSWLKRRLEKNFNFPVG